MAAPVAEGRSVAVRSISKTKPSGCPRSQCEMAHALGPKSGVEDFGKVFAEPDLYVLVHMGLGQPITRAFVVWSVAGAVSCT